MIEQNKSFNHYFDNSSNPPQELFSQQNQPDQARSRSDSIVSSILALKQNQRLLFTVAAPVYLGIKGTLPQVWVPMNPPLLNESIENESIDAEDKTLLVSQPLDLQNLTTYKFTTNEEDITPYPYRLEEGYEKLLNFKENLLFALNSEKGTSETSYKEEEVASYQSFSVEDRYAESLNLKEGLLFIRKNESVTLEDKETVRRDKKIPYDLASFLEEVLRSDEPGKTQKLITHQEKTSINDEQKKYTSLSLDCSIPGSHKDIISSYSKIDNRDKIYPPSQNISRDPLNGCIPGNHGDTTHSHYSKTDNRDKIDLLLLHNKHLPYSANDVDNMKIPPCEKSSIKDSQVYMLTNHPGFEKDLERRGKDFITNLAGYLAKNPDKNTDSLPHKRADSAMGSDINKDLERSIDLKLKNNNGDKINRKLYFQFPKLKPSMMPLVPINDSYEYIRTISAKGHELDQSAVGKEDNRPDEGIVPNKSLSFHEHPNPPFDDSYNYILKKKSAKVSADTNKVEVKSPVIAGLGSIQKDLVRNKETLNLFKLELPSGLGF